MGLYVVGVESCGLRTRNVVKAERAEIILYIFEQQPTSAQTAEGKRGGV